MLVVNTVGRESNVTLSVVDVGMAVPRLELYSFSTHANQLQLQRPLIP